MKKPFLLANLAVILEGLVVLRLSDTSISIADTGVPNSGATSGATSSASKASSPSAGATITMTGILNEWPGNASGKGS